MKSSFWFLTRKFFLALIAISNYKLTRRLKDRIRGESLIRMFRKQVKQGAINLVHKLQLLEAELMSATVKPGKKDDEILQMYESAVVSATRAAFTQDSALASYLCFQFITSRNVKSHLARDYFERSIQQWLAWGGAAIANSLLCRHPDMTQQSSSSLSASMKDAWARSISGSLRSKPRFDPALSLQHKVLTV